MRPILWESEDGKFESRDEKEVAAYEERQKNVLAWLDLPLDATGWYDLPRPASAMYPPFANLINLAPKWLAFFQLHQQLMNDGDMGKWKQRMVIEIDALEQEFMGIVREPKIANPPTSWSTPDSPPYYTTVTIGEGIAEASQRIFADHRDNELQAREDAER